MPISTRSQARSEQPSDLAASPRAHQNPGRVSSSQSELPQQPFKGGVSCRSNRTVGGGPSSLAAGNAKPGTDPIRSCRSDCKTCPALVRKIEFVSFSTGRKYSAVGVNPDLISCKLQNCVYLLSCMSCGVQYVGESIIAINKRMNIHRTSKTGCTFMIEHFNNVCPGASFSIQILEKLPGDGYLNGAIDDEIRQLRLQREDYWMKTLRTIYPYGLNEKTKQMNREVPIGSLFPPLPRYGTKYLETRSRLNRNVVNQLTSLDSFIEHILSLPLKSRGNELRKLLDGFKLKHLRFIAGEARTRLEQTFDIQLDRWYKVIVDIFLTKMYQKPPNKKKAPKHILPIFFDNKGLEHIKLSSILHLDEVIQKLPSALQQDEVPSVVYSLSNTIRNKIFNYKDTVNSIDTNDLGTFGTGITDCDCHNSQFVDEHHGHIVTGDLRIISNPKLRQLISKGPNYREPKTINWKKCREVIADGISTCSDNMISSHKHLSSENMTAWISTVMEKVDAKIALLKRKLNPQKTNPILKQPDVITYLEELHQKFVLVPIDKAANNVAIICKKHYVDVILKEVGFSASVTETYKPASKSKDEIIDDGITYSKKLGLESNDKNTELPVMYWTPKMHKNPSGCRFIIASKTCSTKPISKSVSSAFKLIYKQVETYHANAKFFANYNKFWVLQNSDPVISILKRINCKKRAKSIATYDFSTLYTKLPHDKLITQLFKVIDLVYKGGDKTYIRVTENGSAFWAKKKSHNGVSFSKAGLKAAVSFLVENCYFTVGNLVFQQAIGIPMGIDPAPFWANLFLYTYEEQYITNTIPSDPAKARHFHSTKRFIDDLIAINDGGEFGKVFKDIYPEELDLKIEHSGEHADFLQLDITITNDIFVYKLYDKRDAFPFHIVRMPHKCSNIPQSIFYSALVGEFLRIARSTLRHADFVPKARELIARMRKQGADTRASQRFLRKIIANHQESFSQFLLSAEEIIISLF